MYSIVGVWRSLVAHSYGVRGAVSSNLITPTCFYIVKIEVFSMLNFTVTKSVTKTVTTLKNQHTLVESFDVV